MIAASLMRTSATKAQGRLFLTHDGAFGRLETYLK